MVKQVTTAVFPVAGLGTRFLPITKAGPKEMLPIVDKPLIQYVVEEAVAAGMTQLVFVTSHTKRALEDYFDRSSELERYLREQGKISALKVIESLVPKHVNIVYVRQPAPLGLGDAVGRTQHIVGNQPFAVLLADDIIDCGAKNCLQSMLDIYYETQCSVLAVEKVLPEETAQYGIVSLAQQMNGVNTHQNVKAFQMDGIVEKPVFERAPSNLGVVGRYILTPHIFELLSATAKGIGGEVQLTDAIGTLLQYEKVMAFPFQGRRYDCGSKLGFLEATIAFALQRPDLGGPLQCILKQLLEEATIA